MIMDDQPESPEKHLNELRLEYASAHGALLTYVEIMCPGPHALVMHPDSKPAWCNACGRTLMGIKVGVPT